MSFNVEINDSASNLLDELAENIEGIEEIVGESAKRELMNHLTEKERDASSHSSASRLGADSSGLYADFARALSFNTSNHTVSLSINHAAAAQRYYGGTIKPVNSKYLTIPVAKEAYGKSLGGGDFSDNLLWLFGKGRKPYGVALESDPDTILFILAKSVTQPADPSVLPTDNDWTAAIINTVSDALNLEPSNG